MESIKNRSSLGSILTGLILAGIGVGFLLQAFGLIDFGHYARNWWPLAIIAFGLVQLISAPKAWLGAIITIIMGTWLQLAVLNKFPGNFWETFWPTILIIVGLRIIFNKVWMPRNIDKSKGLESVNVFAGSEIRNESESFEGGSVVAVFGGCKLDLRKAKISEKGAVLNVTAFCGGVEVRVPQEWRVELSGMPILGGWEDKTDHQGDSTKILRINGTVVMGGVEVKN